MDFGIFDILSPTPSLAILIYDYQSFTAVRTPGGHIFGEFGASTCHKSKPVGGRINYQSPLAVLVLKKGLTGRRLCKAAISVQNCISIEYGISIVLTLLSI